MAHHTAKSAYRKLVARLNRFPQGAPPAKRLYQILRLLFSEREAEHVAALPIRPFNAATAAKRWKISLAEARKLLDDLAGRAILVDMEIEGQTCYCLPPPMAGFFEFSMMRTRADIDQKLLAQLYFEYINVEEDFIKALFVEGTTQLGRVFVHEPVLSNQNALHVLDYERASHIIRSASAIGISMCYCRHKMAHMDRSCKAPMDICMTFNTTGASLIRHGFARRVDVAECLDLLAVAHEKLLVQFGENVRTGVNFICNCCGCCCEAMIAQQRFGSMQPVHTTFFLPHIHERECNGCGKCAAACPVLAMAMVSANNPKKPKRKKPRLSADICLGCGVCARACPQGAVALVTREMRTLTPVNSTHRTVLMAIERGRLQHLIFDNQALRSHRALAAVLGVVLKLPPLKQALALEQLKSRYLETLIAVFGN